MTYGPHRQNYAAILSAYTAGEPISAIAARFGCSTAYPGQLAKRRGIPLRRPEDWRREMRSAARRRGIQAAAPSVQFIFVGELAR